jgi:hypothetical protein
MKPWMIPTRYMHDEIERAKLQDKTMAEAGWIKIGEGIWTKDDKKEDSNSLDKTPE